MDRKPEAELMDSADQTRAYAEADFAESNGLFTDRFLGAFPGLSASGHMADLGCGPADICLRLARRMSGWRLTGIDAGENMLRRATEAIAASGLGSRIDLKLARLPDASLGRHCYDAVISNSLLHHLPDPATLWSSVRQLAAPGAPVMVMDLVRPGSEQQAAALVDLYAADAPPILRDDFYNSLLAAYTPEEIQRQLHDAGLEHFHLELASDRHWIAFGTA